MTVEMINHAPTKVAYGHSDHLDVQRDGFLSLVRVRIHGAMDGRDVLLSSRPVDPRPETNLRLTLVEGPSPTSPTSPTSQNVCYTFQKLVQTSPY